MVKQEWNMIWTKSQRFLNLKLRVSREIWISFYGISTHGDWVHWSDSLMMVKALSLSLSVMAILKCCVCFSVNFHAKLRRHLHDYEPESGVEKILSWNETMQNVSFSLGQQAIYFCQARSKTKRKKEGSPKFRPCFVSILEHLFLLLHATTLHLYWTSIYKTWQITFKNLTILRF